MIDPRHRQEIEAFVRERPHALLYDAQAGALLDVFSGKALPLDAGGVATLARRDNAETRLPYLLLVRDDGRQVALGDFGVGFEPVTAATGPISGLPPVVAFRDFANASAQLVHFLLDHPGEQPGPEHVGLVMFCLAILDGARAIGFDVAREERDLERLMNELEARGREGA